MAGGCNISTVVMKARVHRVAGVAFGERAANIKALLGARQRRFVQCQLTRCPLNTFDSEAVRVTAREGGRDIGFVARGSLPSACLVDGEYARLEIGACEAGAGVYARVRLAAR